MKIRWPEVFIVTLILTVAFLIFYIEQVRAEPANPNFTKSEFNQKQDPLPLDSFEINPELLIKLETLRIYIGDKPIIITSGYRSPAYNKRVGGVSRSQHLKGNAADIMVKGMSSKELQSVALDVGFSFTQTYAGKPHLHVDVR